MESRSRASKKQFLKFQIPGGRTWDKVDSHLQAFGLIVHIDDLSFEHRAMVSSLSLALTWESQRSLDDRGAEAP